MFLTLFFRNHLNDCYHSLPFYLYGIHSLIIPLSPLQFLDMDYFHVKIFPLFYLVPVLPILCFSLCMFSCLETSMFLFPFYVSWELSWFDSNFCRDIKLITTSFPRNRCFHVNDHWCQITVTFLVQGMITIWLILTPNLSEQKTPYLLSKLLHLLLFQRLLIQWHSLITCEL